MACYHPLRAFEVGTTPAGKRQMKITGYDVAAVYQFDAGSPWYCLGPDPVAGVPLRPAGAFRFITRSLEIGCGQCVGCRLERSRQWANRCMLELEYHDSAYFVTLTYNEDYVPVSYYDDPETGEAFPSYTLRKKDFQDFMKRLRWSFPDDKIRFFACGEYGPETMRPHYHAILFGLHLDDLKPWSRSPQGFQYYLSPSLQRVWSKRLVPKHQSSVTPMSLPGFDYAPLGHILVSPVTWETCAYTARYVMKKLNGPEAKFYSDFSLEPPFSLMSRKPGIARQWYEDHPDCYDFEYINVSTPTGGRKFRPPRYFDKLYDIDEPEKMAAIKLTRQKMAEASKKAKLSSTSLSYLQLLEVAENTKLGSIKKLERRL